MATYHFVWLLLYNYYYIICVFFLYFFICTLSDGSEQQLDVRLDALRLVNKLRDNAGDDARVFINTRELRKRRRQRRRRSIDHEAKMEYIDILPPITYIYIYN